jgi:hypothetical protein
MNKSVLPLLCAAAALTLPTFASPGADQPLRYHGSQLVAYQQDDADANVDTESDSGGNYDVFYDRLAPQGRWFNDDNYGYVWQPDVAASTSDWRPYADGHWVWTDRGWFWNSNEDFGWATYHYGRWMMVAGTGWVWVPGDQWAPAWVSWRQTENDDYVGWAPLPPEATFNADVGVHPWCDSYYDIGPAAFAFVRIGNFGRPSYRGFFEPAQQNIALIDRTTNVTNVTYNNNAIYNNGPQYQRVAQLVQQQAGQQVPNYKINYAALTPANSAFKTSVQGNQLNVFAPPQKLKPFATAQPQDAKQLGKAQVERGWQNVPQAQAQQLRQQFAHQNPPPQTLPAKLVLPGKPPIQAVTKGEAQPPGGPPKVQPGPSEKLQPFVEKPENSAMTGQQNPKQRNPEAEQAQKQGQIEKGQPENVKPGKPAVVAEQPKGPPPEKTGVEHPQQPANAQPANAQHTAQKQPPPGESSKAKKQEPRKEAPSPPQTSLSQHPTYAVAEPPPKNQTEKVEKAQAQEQVVHHSPQPAPHVAQPPHPQQPAPHAVQAPHPQQPHPPHGAPATRPQQPHKAAAGNQKKENPHPE